MINQSSDDVMPTLFDLKKDGKYLFTFNHRTVEGVNYADVISISQYGNPVSQAKWYFQQGTTTGVLLKNGPGSIHGLVISGVNNNATITMYDGTSSSGTTLWASGAMGAQTIPFDLDLNGAGGIPFDTGLFLVISAANCNCGVKYE